MANFEMTENSEIVLQTCRLLVSHFRHCLEHGGGFHSRLFEHMLHPETKFVFVGKSASVTKDTPTHPEHVVPCAFMIDECKRLIKKGVSDELVASLLAKHWKLALITKEEQRRLDHDLKLKSEMPKGWRFEDGDTFERLKLAKIEIVKQ